MNILGKVDLVVQLGKGCYDVTFVVGDIDSNGILGQDFLRQNVDHINYRKPCLVMGSDIVPLQTVGGSSQICRVEVRETRSRYLHIQECGFQSIFPLLNIWHHLVLWNQILMSWLKRKFFP
ncbi:hypothetical protein DPMN_067081 [Dreissena polymorpha]|uniref:Uncharacterized protein n=1 Tax=Dreissena polymorpha TaxID=45954 RepID=A0A9D3YUN5_DREPO|nr:hypothetical protein DPMN_067081 [Dreissena polymorpha]